ncbi:hypothetical protein [Maridesulfovibrio bastinii]|uniref:hypothetical protein n=1 Tax=Maridesulfovibrio bastinii TaxID=47157 RepID=UPI00041ABC80|nr:hypothetical protein [Maridesulfovibrio bastinii]
MKIFGYGNYSNQHKNGSSNKKSVIFRNRYRVGQKLRGTLLKWERQNFGWIEVENLSLLAKIQSTPSVGDILTFIVEQLYPDIILKEITADSGNDFSTMTPQEAAGDFIAARAKFESKSLRIFSQNYLPKLPTYTQFCNFLLSDSNHTDRFFNVLRSVTSLNSFSKGNSILLYMPWLIPEGYNHEALINVTERSNREDNFYEGIFCFTHSQTGNSRLKILYKKQTAAFKLISSNQINSNNFSQLKKNNTVEFIGYEKISPNESSSILPDFINSISK